MYMKEEEFLKETRHIRNVYNYEDKMIVFESVPTCLAGEVEFGSYFTDQRFEDGQLVEGKILNDTPSRILKLADELEEGVLDVIKNLEDKRPYKAVVRITAITTVYKDGKKELISSNTAILSDYGLGEYDGS